MTPLGALLIERIRAGGPITVAGFMSECLMHPTHGYYSTRDPFGVHGDFTTAPEISQMFGELLGLCLAQAWLDRGSPTPFTLAELGPGRGTLMADLLRATKCVPGFHDAMQLCLVETSPTLRRLQSDTIQEPHTHAEHVVDIPDGPLFVIANEFFDALPIRQFQRGGAAWRERVIGVQDEALAFGLADPTSPAFLNDRLGDTKDGDVVEFSPASEAITAQLGARIERDGGVALIVDYGDWHSLGDTLQALANHEATSPLKAPGMADLTAHVDFEVLAKSASPAAFSRVTPQGVFLERLGITDRARALAASLEGDRLDSHIKAHRRLTHGDEMGTLFKVMALYRTSETPPPGLEP